MKNKFITCKFCSYQWEYTGIAITGQYATCPMCKGSNKLKEDEEKNKEKEAAE